MDVFSEHSAQTKPHRTNNIELVISEKNNLKIVSHLTKTETSLGIWLNIVTIVARSVHLLPAHMREDVHATPQLHCQWRSGQCHAKLGENAASLHNTTLRYKKPSYRWDSQPFVAILEHRIPMPELFTELRFSMLREFWAQEIRLPLLGGDAPRLGWWNLASR